MNQELGHQVDQYLKRQYDQPRTKYSYPQTESQEIGWYYDHPKIEPFLKHDLVASQETKFNDLYSQYKKQSDYIAKELQTMREEKLSKIKK